MGEKKLLDKLQWEIQYKIDGLEFTINQTKSQIMYIEQKMQNLKTNVHINGTISITLLLFGMLMLYLISVGFTMITQIAFLLYIISGLAFCLIMTFFFVEFISSLLILSENNAEEVTKAKLVYTMKMEKELCYEVLNRCTKSLIILREWEASMQSPMYELTAVQLQEKIDYVKSIESGDEIPLAKNTYEVRTKILIGMAVAVVFILLFLRSLLRSAGL